MPQNRRRVKEDAWVGLGVAALVVYALLADWWKTHAIIGWTILIILTVGVGFVLYRYASIRGWLGRKVKDTVSQLVYEDEASEREPLSSNQRDAILQRAQYRCENERCNYQGKPHIHHIDMKNSNNNLSNLIALCPNCHQKAHHGKFTSSQLYNWAKRDFKKFQARRTYR